MHFMFSLLNFFTSPPAVSGDLLLMAGISVTTLPSFLVLVSLLGTSLK